MFRASRRSTFWALACALCSGTPAFAESDDPGMQSVAMVERCTDETQRITVDLMLRPTAENMGEVAVLVPRDMAAGKSGFSFPLPQELSRLAVRGADLRVEAIAGGPLPRWLRYDARRRWVVAVGVPDGALPVQLLVTVEGMRTVMTVAVRPHQRRN